MTVYTIRVIGHIDAHWSEWFDGLMITNAQPGEAMISGEIVDEAALHGTLNKTASTQRGSKSPVS
jgi:hypothetical protein